MAIHYACLYGHWSCAQVMMEPRWVVQNPGGLRPLAQVRCASAPRPCLGHNPFRPVTRLFPHHSLSHEYHQHHTSRSAPTQCRQTIAPHCWRSCLSHRCDALFLFSHHPLPLTRHRPCTPHPLPPSRGNPGRLTLRWPW